MTTPKLIPRATCQSGIVGGNVSGNKALVTRKPSLIDHMPANFAKEHFPQSACYQGDQVNGQEVECTEQEIVHKPVWIVAAIE